VSGLKEKINLLSKGIFEYERPEIVVSEEMIQINVESGNIFTGYFDVDSINSTDIRAMIFSSNKLMACKETNVIGTNNRINYEFDSSRLEPGEVITGHFSVISNGGEVEVPFQVTVCLPYCETSVGHIRDLAGFSNLAQENWHEAVKLFRSSHFKRVFLVNKKHAHIYDNLIQSRNKNQALEEFLCTLKKKKKINIKVSRDEIEHMDLQELYSDRIVIEKDGWGYQKVSISTEGDFLSVYKNELTTEDFLGSYYELEYVIAPEYFRHGNNYGKIVIQTFSQTIEIPVNCIKGFKRNDVTERKSLKEGIFEMSKNFLLLQMKQTSFENWRSETREAVDCCLNNSKEIIYHLHEAHFMVRSGEKDNAKEILDGINGREIRHKSVSWYCYFLYISSLVREDANYTKFALDKIETYYEHHGDWRLLWMLLEMNPKIQNSRRYIMIKAAFYNGCKNPILYFEALKVVNKDPSLMREFGAFETQLVTWGTKNDCIEREVVFQYAELAIRGKNFNPLALRTLIQQCDIYEHKDILTAVCSLLIRGEKTDTKYHKWYALGVESSLKLTRLYEYYMYSLEGETIKTLPIGVMIYFNYNNQLSAWYKAMLYAYIVKNKDTQPKIYRDYENIMKAFTHERLKAGDINENLVVLFRHFIAVAKVNYKVAEQLPGVMFKHQIICHHQGIKGVIVSHREVEAEQYYPLTNQKAYVDICMEDYYLIFVDKQENRYLDSIEYELVKLMDEREYMKICYDLNPNNPCILLNRSERAMKYQKTDEISIDIYKRTLKLQNIKDQYYKNILKNLIDFYYDNYEGETLEKYLLKLDISKLDGVERGGIIEYFIQRGLFDRAYDAVVRYGYDNIQDKKLMRMCSRIIRDMRYQKDDFLVEMSYYTFSCGKYDDVILEYLIRHYLGTTKDLFGIWKAAKDFEVNAYELEEKLLCQILFSEAFVNSGVQIFASYYKMKPNDKIVKAFLAYYSYNYLVKEKDIDARLFSYIEIELNQMEKGRDVCSLALLKYYSGLPDFDNGQKQFIKDETGYFMDKGMILPFFKTFIDAVGLPHELLDRVYVQYCTNPKNTVRIHYMFDDGNQTSKNFVEEDMRNVFGGIFVKAFRLFSDEQVQYYISEKNEFSETITESKTIRENKSWNKDKATGYDKINHMTQLCIDEDDEALKKSIEDFEQMRYVSGKLFTILQ